MADRKLCPSIFVVVPFSPAPSLFEDSGAGYKRPITLHRRRHRSTRPTAVSPPCAGRATPDRSYGLLFERRAYSHVCTAAHALLSHAGLPFHNFVPPGHRSHPAYSRTFLLMDWHEHLHPVVVAQLLEVLSTQNVAADGPVAHHHVALAKRTRHSRQRRLLRPAPGDAPR